MDSSSLVGRTNPQYPCGPLCLMAAMRWSSRRKSCPQQANQPRMGKGKRDVLPSLLRISRPSVLRRRVAWVNPRISPRTAKPRSGSLEPRLQMADCHRLRITSRNRWLPLANFSLPGKAVQRTAGPQMLKPVWMGSQCQLQGRNPSETFWTLDRGSKHKCRKPVLCKSSYKTRVRGIVSVMLGNCRGQDQSSFRKPLISG